MSKEWINGNVGGSMNLLPNKTSYVVRFVGNGPSKNFLASKYGGLEAAEDAALAYRRKMSEKYGLTKNKYRFIDGYIEFQIYGGHIGKIDYDDFPKLVHTWCAKKGHHRYYTQSTKLGKYLHNLIFPKWKIVDHINRDGLDNRRRNLRDGNKDNINVKNQKRKDNAFGKTGVHFSNYKNGSSMA